MKVDRVDKYHKEIIEFSKEKNIPIRNGKVSPVQIGEIHNHLEKLLERDKKRKDFNECLKEIKFDVKKLLGRR